MDPPNSIQSKTTVTKKLIEAPRIPSNLTKGPDIMPATIATTI